MNEEVIIDRIQNYDSTLLSMIFGKLLGDGSITKQLRRRPRFQFMHRIHDKEWCFFCYKQLKVFIPLNPPKYKKVNDGRLLKGYSESYYVQSKTDDLITLLETIWYKNRKKIIPLTLLNNYLDIHCLSWWYQDDGHLNIKNGIPKKVILSTESFTPQENILLIKLIKDKFYLSFSSDDQNRLVLYDQFQIYYFLHLIKNHLSSGMKRKSLPQYTQNIICFSKRTSIYLPSSINISKPTKEINNSFNNLDYLLNLIEKDYESFYLECNCLLKNQTKPYQIVVSSENLKKLEFIKKTTGLTYSQSATACFLLF